MASRSLNQVWREIGNRLTGLPFNEWLAKQRADFDKNGQGNNLDFSYYVDCKYRQMVIDAERRAEAQLKAKIDAMNKPTPNEIKSDIGNDIAGVQVDFEQDKLYEMFPADGGSKIPADGGSAKTIIGLKPPVFYAVTAAVSITAILIVVTMIKSTAKAIS